LIGALLARDPAEKALHSWPSYQHDGVGWFDLVMYLWLEQADADKETLLLFRGCSRHADRR
jgi:hypothetical protein